MPLFDKETGEYNAGAFALDTHAAIAGDKSIFESMGDVITKGLPLTGLSAINSIANTAIDIGNFFGGDFERVSMEKEVGEGDMLDYYKQHEQGVEAAGLLVGSLLPGTIAIKALKLAQAGAQTNALVRATNIFAGPKKSIVEGALAEIEAGDAALYGQIKVDKYKAIALGFGDQALQALAYEAATVATMKASPLLDKDGFVDTVNNMFWGSLLGGGVGGFVDGIITHAAFKGALKTADLNTKAQELVTYLGKGNYLAGDRVVAVLDSLEAIPTPGTKAFEELSNLGKKKASASRDAAILNSKKVLGSLVDGEDKELTNGMFDVLLNMKEKQGMDKEEMYNYLSRLSKVSRIDSETQTPSGSIFYINRAAPKEPFTSFGQLITNTPEATAEFSLGYKLRPSALQVKVARFDDTVEWEGMKTPKFVSAADAFSEGNDVFISKELKIFVNEDAPNLERVARPGESRALNKKEEIAYRETGQLPEGSQPLYGAPLILNVKNGAIRERAVPVVGDYGPAKLFDKGLAFGDKTSLQAADTPVTKATSTIDANARYVWAAERGIQKGDVIASNDIAMLEQLYNEAISGKQSFSDYMVLKDAGNVKIADSELPSSANQLLNMIRTAKDDLLHDLIIDNPKMSSEELALRANVPQSYIENNFKAGVPKDYMIPASEHATLNNVKLEYNIGNIYQQDGMILRGLLDMQYRINLAKSALQDNAAHFFGPEWEQFIAAGSSADANIEGVGAKAFSASNANYGSLGQEMERIGRLLTDRATKRMAEVSETLSSSVNAIRDDAQAAAELGMFRAVRQRTGERYTFLPADIAAKKGLSADTAVLEKSLVKDKAGNITDWRDDVAPAGFILRKNSAENIKGSYNYYELSPKVAAFERANQEINDYRVIARNNWNAAQGLNRVVNPGSLYTPPIDTAKYPHFALVKMRRGTGMASDDVSIVTAETAADLEQKIAVLKDDFSVYTKDLLKTHHEVLGDYEYGRNFSQTYVDSQLQRRGVLNNIFPDTRAETIIKDYIDWHSKQELRLLRDHVETGNGQLFAELRAMGDRFTSAETSKTGFVGKFLGKTVSNPYNSYIKTALGISEKEEYRLWHESNEKLEAFFSTAFRMGKESFQAANKGLLPYEEASKVAEKFGLGNPYKDATDAAKAYYDIANKLPPEKYLSKFVATANSVLAGTAIRLDFFQSVINAVSTPVLLLAETNSAIEGVKKLLTTELPDGSGRMIPATSKVFYNAIGNWFNKDARDTLLPIYQGTRTVRTKSSEYFEMIDQLTLPYGKFTESQTIASLKKATDLGAKLTGSELSEEFGRFIAADSARQIFEAAGYKGKQLTDNIATFVNRVHGNYVASQRPIAFQGPIGQAVGLFQTYQFNLMQQLFRYVENGEGKTLSILAGVQSTLFGFQGLPGFQAINNHIVGNAANNPAHKDVYSTVPNLVDEKLGNYLLYGVLSNWMQTGLYSRGDINPRQITILPVNPLDFPAVSGGVRFIGDILDTTEKIANGGKVAPSFLLGLEHNGLSRPLMGLGQILQGYSSTSKGSLVATTRPQFGDNTAGLSDWLSVATFSRLLGARPLDEAVTMDAMYRKTLYTAKDTSRMQAVGEAVKTSLVGNSSPSESDLQNFATRYAAAGGRIENFGRKMIEWSQDANASVANQVYRSLKNPLNQQMMVIMGGKQLPDYTNNPVTP